MRIRTEGNFQMVPTLPAIELLVKIVCCTACLEPNLFSCQRCSFNESVMHRLPPPGFELFPDPLLAPDLADGLIVTAQWLKLQRQIENLMR